MDKQYMHQLSNQEAAEFYANQLRKLVASGKPLNPKIKDIIHMRLLEVYPTRFMPIGIEFNNLTADINL